MCMSPHEMSTARIEQIIQEYKNLLEDPSVSHYHNNYCSHLELYEELLKERAETGTY